MSTKSAIAHGRNFHLYHEPFDEDYVYLELEGAKFEASSPSANRIRALIGIDNLAPGGEPDALVLLDVSEGALEIFDAQRLSDDHRVKRNAHHSWLLRAVGVKRVELIDHGAKILLAGVAFSDK
jgi:hypothetical protein